MLRIPSFDGLFDSMVGSLGAGFAGGVAPSAHRLSALHDQTP